jgi:hypothetical protein
MSISNEEYVRRKAFYISVTPRLDWFTSSEQDALIAKAEANARAYNRNFINVLESLTFTASFTKDRRSFALQSQ